MPHLLSTLLFMCVPYGPAVSDQNPFSYKLMEPFVFIDHHMKTSSVDELGRIQKWNFKIIKDEADLCPGQISLQNSEGQYGLLKEITTSLNGWSRGQFYFADSNGEEFRVLFECPQITLNPNCIPDESTQ
jgi:hypothetical protein